MREPPDLPQLWGKLNLAFRNIYKGPIMVKVFRTASESYLVFDFARNLNIHSAIVHHVHGPLHDRNLIG